MFVFLMAVRHPDSANNYGKVGELLSITLNSLLGQTNGNFQIVVVCNKKPVVSVHDERIHYHLVDFPGLEQQLPSELNVPAKFKDKGTKYMSGLLFAKQFNPKQVYIVDADDWFNINIIDYLDNQENHPVWYVNKGYFVDLDKLEYKGKSGLARYCGSTFVYDYQFLMNHAEIKNEINEFSSQEELIAGTSDFFILKLLCNHTINYRYFRLMGITPKEIKLRAACWVQGTGENVSGVSGGSHGIAIDKAFVNEFNLEPLLIKHKSSLWIIFRESINSIRSQLDWLYTRVTKKSHY